MTSVTLIAPRTEKMGGADISVIRTPLTGLLTLATILDREGYTVNFYDESFKKPDYDEINSDFVLLSSMSATAKRAYRIASRFEDKDTTVIMGGLHPSFKPKEALQYCDKVVIGEGERVITDLIKGKNEKKMIIGDSIPDLSKVPMPNYDLVEGMGEHPKIVSVCASRGCPYRCNFCSLHRMFGNKIRNVSNDRLIQYLKKFDRLKTLCFDEPNFIADKKRTVNLLKKMREHDVRPKRTWVSVSLDIAKYDEVLKLCSEVSDFNLVIGLESIDQKVLNSYNKKQSPTQIKKGLQKIHNYGIKVEGSFIFGEDHDDKNVFENTVEFCHQAEIDFPAFFPLTPYVGTEIRDKLLSQKRIFSNNWDWYDNLHTVFYPKNMSPLELQEGVIESYENFYSTTKGLKHIFKGQFFYGGVNFYLKYLFKKMKRENREYLTYLERIS
ncbi:MAG: B12-binding domain-containing radical SAM protein [Thermoplasmatota archaeon]